MLSLRAANYSIVAAIEPAPDRERVVQPRRKE